MTPPRIAVIGAGLAGIACARSLAARGFAPALFDKGRAAGGRLATRRAGDGLQFDHGAQYLTARGPAFAASLAEAGAAPWPDPGRWVGTPAMSALPRRLVGDLPLALQRHVTGLVGAPGAWWVAHRDAARPEAPPQQDGPFDAVAITLPAPQAAPLVPALAARLDAVRLAPCWTLMVAFPARLALPDRLRPEAGPIGWAARDSSKPGRDPAGECWVVQAGPAWSRAHLEDPEGQVAAALLAALGAAPAPVHAVVHRWRFAAVEAPLGAPCLWDGGLRIGLAGDWCLAARAEAAFDSGLALACAIAA